MMTSIYDGWDDAAVAAGDFGYDPTVPEPGPFSAPPQPSQAPPPSATVNPAWLPPAGHQTTPSCFVWASTYGLATFAAAQAGRYSPTSPNLQASPGYLYVAVLENEKLAPDTCVGGHISACLDLLQLQGGTPSMQAAPVPDGCAAVWNAYGGHSVPPDPAFAVGVWRKIDVKPVGTGLEAVRTMIAQGTPLAYGTRLYTDFKDYAGSPVPYVGNGTLARKADGKLVGHCMLIIGYDDTLGGGAVLIQNSFGLGWGGSWNGSGGYVWMSYETFHTLAQGAAFYIESMAL